MPSEHPYAAENNRVVHDVAARRGLTLGHLRDDGGCELAQIMRRLDKAEAEVERLRAALRGVIARWDEFGPEYGLEETMDIARRALSAGDKNL